METNVPEAPGLLRGPIQGSVCTVTRVFGEGLSSDGGIHWRLWEQEQNQGWD